MASKKMDALLSLLGGAGTFAVAHTLRTAVILAGAGIYLALPAEALLGALAATTVYVLLRRDEMQRELKRREQYDAVVAELHHHIRNALQLILNRTELLENGSYGENPDVRGAVHRIEWALQEILPAAGESPRRGHAGRAYSCSRNTRRTPAPGGGTVIEMVQRRPTAEDNPAEGAKKQPEKEKWQGGESEAEPYR